MIGLEPSCVAVFRDELTEILPANERATRMSRQTFTLGEFLDRHASRIALPKLHRKAIVHGHCHHRAIMKMEAERRVLDALGLDYELLDSGCCGMAGSFGFEREHYDLSRKVGELVLLPAVRDADETTLIVADGFSCREQIAQTTRRRAMHLAEVIALASKEETEGRVERLPELQWVPDYAAAARQQGRVLVAAALTGLALGAYALYTVRRPQGRVEAIK